MVNEQQKYLSVTLRNIGFALLTPACSTVFQWLVFRDKAYFDNLSCSMILFVIGVIFLERGYNSLKEIKNGN